MLTTRGTRISTMATRTTTIRTTTNGFVPSGILNRPEFDPGRKLPGIFL
jgi:hypothetical protein